MAIQRVELSGQAKKDLRKVPAYIGQDFYLWWRHITSLGLDETQKKQTPSYNDKPAKGQRKGERTARFSRGYRVFYEVREDSDGQYVWVLQVNKHDY